MLLKGLLLSAKYNENFNYFQYTIYAIYFVIRKKCGSWLLLY